MALGNDLLNLGDQWLSYIFLSNWIDLQVFVLGGPCVEWIFEKIQTKYVHDHDFNVVNDIKAQKQLALLTASLQPLTIRSSSSELSSIYRLTIIIKKF